jgi:hypothetical protein
MFEIPEKARRALEAQPEQEADPAEPDTQTSYGAGAGTRGGPLPPSTLEEAQDRFGTWREEEYGWVKNRILELALTHGEFHADQLAEQPFAQRNVIGAAVNALVCAGLLVSTGEHRKGTSPAAHGRKSYVYCLTGAGRHQMEQRKEDA